MKKVLVTGGAGFIGSQVVRDLLDQGVEVSALDDLSTGSKTNIPLDHPKLKFFEGSILNPETVKTAASGCEGVLHLAVSNLRKSLSDPRISHEVNASGTLTVLETIKTLGIKRFVYISSSEIYGTAQTAPMSEDHPTKPCTVYAASKLAGEHYTHTFSKLNQINATVVRPFNNYGPRSHFERENGEIIPRTMVRLLNGLPAVLYGSGKQTRDFQYVADTSRGLIQVLNDFNCDGETFNLAFGAEVQMVDLVKKIAVQLNIPLDPKFLGIDRPGDVQRHFADSSKFFKRFGFKPTVNIDQGLAMYLEWFKKEHGDAKALLSEVQEVNW